MEWTLREGELWKPTETPSENPFFKQQEKASGGKDMKKCYLVYGSRGEYSDYREWCLRVFLDKEKAEQFRKAAENYLLDNHLFTRTEEETKWGRRVSWIKNPEWDWGQEEGLRCEACAKTNIWDTTGEYAEGYNFQGYSIDEIELKE